MTYMAFSGLINLLCASSLAIFVGWRCTRRDVRISYGMMNFFIAFWSFWYMLWQFADSPRLGYFRMQMLQFGAMGINQALLIFVAVLLGPNRKRKILIAAALALNTFFAVLNGRGDLYKSAALIPGFGYWPQPTKYFIVYLVFWHAEIIYAFYDLARSLRHAKGRFHEQIRYFLLAFGLGYLGGVCSWLPWFRILLMPYPNILISVYTMIVAYAILRHRLMDIQLVFRRTLLYSLVSIVLVCVYAVVVTLGARLLEGHVLRPSVYSSAGAAVAIALIVYPINKVFDRWLDRKFFRHELERWRQEYAGALVHEIKTPLAAISLPAELTLGDTQDILSERVSGIDVALKIKKRMTTILERVQQASQRLDGIQTLMSLNPRTYRAIPLAAPIEAAFSALSDLFRRHQVKIRLSPIPPVKITGNSDQLEIVFSNLLKNAVEAMAKTPELNRCVTLETEEKRREIIIHIRDQGSGFNVPADQLFTPFYSTKEKAERGIGLFLCRQIIHAHRGSIEALNRPEGGAEFEIRVPLCSH